MSKLNEVDTAIVEMYFENSILEITEGLPKEILQEALEYYEEGEHYLACAGIKKALDWYDMHTFTKVMVKMDEIMENREE
jgi:hypothetical protein